MAKNNAGAGETAQISPFPGEKVCSSTAFSILSCISSLVPEFLIYAQFEQRLAKQTIMRYRDNFRRFIGEVGDIPIEKLNLEHFTDFKQKLFSQGRGEARVASVISAMRSFLKYCQDVRKLKTINPGEISVPKIPRREVIFLTDEDIRRFLESIKIKTLYGLRFRTLVEVFLGTGMRLSEALSLDKNSIDYARKEARIIGKGNKERVVFFSDRALLWIGKYLSKRWDNNPALFIAHNKRNVRLGATLIQRDFQRYRKKAGLNKKVSACILRHTVATTLLFSGCPINNVKEILGHERLETTTRYYLGVDKRQAKEAHQKYLKYKFN